MLKILLNKKVIEKNHLWRFFILKKINSNGKNYIWLIYIKGNDNYVK